MGYGGGRAAAAPALSRRLFRRTTASCECVPYQRPALVFLLVACGCVAAAMGDILNSGPINEAFLRLQWAIDSSFIQLRTNKRVGVDLFLQEVPLSNSATTLSQSNLATNIAIAYMDTVYLDFATWVGLYVPYFTLLLRLIEYRATGLEELLKMIGVTPTLLKLSHFINMLPCCLIYSLSGSVITKISSTPMLPKTSAVIVFLFLMLNYTSFIILAFAVCHAANTNNHATTITIMSFFAWNIISELLMAAAYKSVSKACKVMLGLFPNMPNKIFWINVDYFESKGAGATFNNFFDSPDNSKGLSACVCLVILIIQIVLCLGLIWYLAKVRPGPYGIGLPYSFLCNRSYWHKMSKEEELAMTVKTEPASLDRNLFEPMDNKGDVGLKLIDVSKVYGTKVVLSHVTLDVYRGEITLLLGHNGAGKTTLISIITGMTKMTAGSVFVNGVSLATHPKRVRRDLGYCPQHNLTVPVLSVLQQVVFFAMLKGEKHKEAQISSKALLAELGMATKLNNTADQLSGGMKRRLQLACALSGGSSVLILDEPTSGMDVETRRELWNLLLSLRGKRTVLLTTHYMEEADVLGDRVAALHGGVLRCYGTPMFLKKGIGSGYRISFTTIGLPQEEAITRAITSVIPQATLREKGYNSITYVLPSQDSTKFPALFSLLETQRSSLNIESIGVGVSTLEDVFLKLCSDVNTEFTEDTTDISIPGLAFAMQQRNVERFASYTT